jgi:hypothetical protein
MIALKLWSISIPDKSAHAQGIVSGHPILDDGEYATTTRIEKIEYADGLIKATTESNNEYNLRLSDIREYGLSETIKNLHKIGLDSITEDLYYKYLEKDLSDKLNYVDSILNNNELYMEMISTNTIFSAFKHDNTVSKIKVTEHSDTFTDSVLVSDFRNHLVDFRYFVRFSGIEPYHWSDNIDSIKIKNIGSTPIGYHANSFHVDCIPNEITTIDKTNSGSEGLMSPDQVNGKSLLSAMIDNDFENKGESE